MERTGVGLVLVAVFAVAVLGVAASSIDSAPIRGGFGIEGGSGTEEVETPSTTTAVNQSIGRADNDGGGAVGGDFAGSGFDAGGSGGSGDGSSTSLLVLVALAGVAVAGIGLVFWATGDDADPLTDVGSATEEPTDDHGTEPERSGPIEPTNEVYRAWWEMARSTGTDSARARSPAEFATAAIEAGMDPEAVAELTRLFRGVRYGGASITDETEQRATDALDRVRRSSDARTPSDARSPNDTSDSGPER